MKKINVILPLIFLFIGIYILIGGYIKTNNNDSLKVYSLKSYNEYLYEEDKTYEITYYTTCLISDKEYYLKGDNNKVLLTNTKETVSKSVYNNEIYYIVTVLFTLGSPTILNNAYLEIINNEYNISLSLGTFKVVECNDDFVDYNKIEGHYTYINNNLVLVGISVEFNKSYTLKELIINDDSFIQIQNIYRLENNLDNIITDYKYNIYDKSNGEITIEPNTKYYLPIGYNKLVLLGRINILLNNDKYLYLPALQLSKLDLNEYPGFIRSGEIVRNN